MPIAKWLWPFALVSIAACLSFAQQPERQPPAAQPTQDQPKPAEPKKPQEQPAEQPAAPEAESQENPSPQPTKPSELPKDVRAYAWKMLQGAIDGNKTASRASAVRVLGLITKNGRAEKLAEKALLDTKPEVRAGGAMALGNMQARSSIPKLKDALADADPAVVLAAAHALDLMHDDSVYEVYYEILTGERKGSKGMVASQAAELKDPKKLALMGFEEGIGFVPFAGMGWEAYRRLTKTDTSPVRAAAIKVLIKDSDPDTGKAIGKAATTDKNWIVRAAALEALAKRDDTSQLEQAEYALWDDKEAVRFTAAATVIHLSDVKAAPKAKPKTTRKRKK